MNYVFWGTIAVLGATAIYYIVFYSLLYYWHEKKTTFVVVPLLFTFEFFAIVFLLFALGMIMITYIPGLAPLFSR